MISYRDILSAKFQQERREKIYQSTKDQLELCEWFPALFLDESEIGGPVPWETLVALNNQGRDRLLYIRKKAM